MSDATSDPTVDPQQLLLEHDEAPAPRGWLGRFANADSLVVTLLAFLTAMLVGGVLIASADPQTQAAAHYFFQYPWDTFRYGFEAMWNGYKAMFEGAIFNPKLAQKGTLAGYLGPISETLTNATPLILGGLSVGLAFRAGLGRAAESTTYLRMPSLAASDEEAADRVADLLRHQGADPGPWRAVIAAMAPAGPAGAQRVLELVSHRAARHRDDLTTYFRFPVYDQPGGGSP